MSEENSKPRLNTLKPTPGSRKPRRRVGRGLGSGRGVTCGSGDKGQKSRSGGRSRIGFEGGQMPLQRRLPKIGFRSRRSALSDEIRLHELVLVGSDIVDRLALLNAGLISSRVKKVKVIMSGEIHTPVTVKGLAVTAGARKCIEAAGGKVEE